MALLASRTWSETATTSWTASPAARAPGPALPAAHPDLYAETRWGPRLAIRGGALEIGSLDTPGLGARGTGLRGDGGDAEGGGALSGAIGLLVTTASGRIGADQLSSVRCG